MHILFFFFLLVHWLGYTYPFIYLISYPNFSDRVLPILIFIIQISNKVFPHIVPLKSLKSLASCTKSVTGTWCFPTVVFCTLLFKMDNVWSKLNSWFLIHWVSDSSWMLIIYLTFEQILQQRWIVRICGELCEGSLFTYNVCGL